MADRRLQVFATVARLLSFTKAAEALHMTQPAVTFQIRQLEEHFNTRLFDRTHNRITLTNAGEVVKQYADQIIVLNHEMENEVRTLTGDIQGPLLIGASTTIAEYLIPDTIGSFKAKYPDVRIRLYVNNTNGIIQFVESNEIDIGIVEGPVSNKNLVKEGIRNDELVCICPINHPLSIHKRITADKVLEYPFISREEGSGTRNVLETYLDKHEVDLDHINIIMEFGSPESIKSAVTAGLGVSILSIATLEKELALGHLVAIPLSPPIRRTFSIVYQRQKFRLRAMEKFLEFSREHYTQRHRFGQAEKGTPSTPS